jgi:hypothetical protein
LRHSYLIWALTVERGAGVTKVKLLPFLLVSIWLLLVLCWFEFLWLLN